jgi:hypothetical protein
MKLGRHAETRLHLEAALKVDPVYHLARHTLAELSHRQTAAQPATARSPDAAPH